MSDFIEAGSTAEAVHNAISLNDGQTAAPQAPQAPQSPQDKPQDQRTMAIIARMEKTNREKESAWKAKEKEYNELKARAEKYAPLEEKFNRVKENPWELINEAGWDLEKLARHATENANDDELDPIAKRIKTSEMTQKQLEAKILELEKRLSSKDEQEKQYNQELFNREISSFLTTNKEKYEFLSVEDGAVETIKDLITQDLLRQKDEGIEENEMQVMSLEDAAALLETKLDEYYSKRLTLNKVQSRSSKPARTLGEGFGAETRQESTDEAENLRRAEELVRSWNR